MNYQQTKNNFITDNWYAKSTYILKQYNFIDNIEYIF